MIRIRCRSCDRLWGLANSQVGKVFRCPGCGQEAVLPSADASPSPIFEFPTGRAFLRADSDVSIPIPPAVPPPAFTRPAPAPARSPERVATRAAPAPPSAPPTSPRPERVEPPRPSVAAPALQLDPIPTPRAGAAAPPGRDDLPVLEAVPDSEPIIELADDGAPLAVPPPPAAELLVKPKKRRKGKKKKKKARFWEGGLEFQRTVLLPVIGMLCLWLLLVTVGIWASEMYLFLLIFGFVIFGAGKRMLLAEAMDEGMFHWLACLFMPFYPTYYFFTRPDRIAGPFVVGCCGVLYLASSLGLYTFHYWHEFQGPRVVRDKDGTLHIDEEDARCERLLRDTETADALEWLQVKGVKHYYAAWQPDEAVENIKLMQQLGAKVWVAGIENIRDGKGSQESWKMVVRLPSDREKRESLFKLKAKWFPGNEKEDERKQTYMLLEQPDPQPMQ